MNTDEEAFFGYLLNDEPDNLPQYSGGWSGWHMDYEWWWQESSGTSTLFDFSDASNNGNISFEFEIVPEPVTMILVGAGGVFVMRRRRGED